MKTRYKFIHFDQMTDTDWICCNNKTNDPLGRVEYYKPWRQSVFIADDTSLFSHDCLTDIADFLQQLNQKSK